MRVRRENTNSIDKKAEDVNNFLLLAENVLKYQSSTYGKWISISKVLKSKPKLCRRRWKTLRKHFGLGLLTNRQLIDKLQFLKDVSNEIPASQLRNNLVSCIRTLPITQENSSLISVSLVDPIEDAKKNTFIRKEGEVTEKSKRAKDITKVHENTSPLVDTEKSKRAKYNNGIKINEGYDSDLEIIEPYIETIEVE